MVNSSFDPFVEEPRGSIFQLSLTMLIFLFALGLAEWMVYFSNPVQGLILHAGILVAFVLYLSARWDQPQYHYLLGLSIVPMMRIISLALPLQYFSLAFWYILVNLVLLVAVLIFAQRSRLTYFDLRINLYDLQTQLLIGLSGILIGIVHYFIVKPSLLVTHVTFSQQIFLGVVLLICNSFVEELIFRGLLQHIAEKIMPEHFAWLYVAAMYAVLMLGSYSLGSLAFTLVISLIFSWVASRTESIFGISLAHGLASVTLFVIIPGLSL